jgi:hypothetical protein
MSRASLRASGSIRFGASEFGGATIARTTTSRDGGARTNDRTGDDNAPQQPQQPEHGHHGPEPLALRHAAVEREDIDQRVEEHRADEREVEQVPAAAKVEPAEPEALEHELRRVDHLVRRVDVPRRLVVPDVELDRDGRRVRKNDRDHDNVGVERAHQPREAPLRVREPRRKRGGRVAKEPVDEDVVHREPEHHRAHDRRQLLERVLLSLRILLLGEALLLLGPMLSERVRAVPALDRLGVLRGRGRDFEPGLHQLALSQRCVHAAEPALTRAGRVALFVHDVVHDPRVGRAGRSKQ